MSRSEWFRRVAAFPTLSVTGFLALYVLAALLYPGGTRSDWSRARFSVIDNYFCDLLDKTTYGGRANPGAPLAVAATVVLAFGLSALFWTVPTLFPSARVRGGMVRASGVLAATVTPFVATRLHDSAIHLGVLCGMSAFLLTMSAVRFREGHLLGVLALATLGMGLVNYVFWATRFGLPALPLIQKATFALLLAWIVVLSRRVQNVPTS